MEADQVLTLLEWVLERSVRYNEELNTEKHFVKLRKKDPAFEEKCQQLLKKYEIEFEDE